MKTITKHIYTILLLIPFLSLQGCFSTSMMTTAKTLDKGEQQVTVGVSGYTLYGEKGLAPDIQYRRGINDKIDFGVGYSMGILGHVRGDVKYELLSWNNGNNFLSTGLGFDLYVPSEYGGEVLIGNTIPLYLSLNHNNAVVPYFAQRFTIDWFGLNTFRYQNASEPITSFKSIEHTMVYSGAAGLRFGEKRTKYFVEASYGFHAQNSFGAWESSTPGEYVNTSKTRNFSTFQITLGLSIGPKK